MPIFSKLFKNKKIYQGSIVDIKEKYRTDIETAYDGVPTVYYDILKHNDKTRVGSIDLRLSIEGDMYYYGHIGYSVIKKYRGNHYAYYASRLLFEVARKEFDMDELIITCSPENTGSYKTLLKLGGVLIEEVDIPKRHMLYLLGERSKYVFRFNIRG